MVPAPVSASASVSEKGGESGAHTDSERSRVSRWGPEYGNQRRGWLKLDQ
jgi:hypothetical protein